MFHKIILFTMLVFTFALGQSPTMALSPATADGSDAMEMNSAGLGINHGIQGSMFFNMIKDEQGDDFLRFRYTGKMEGFGYHYSYDKENGIDYAFALGGKIHPKGWFGYRYSSIREARHHFGYLTRPCNYFSLGADISVNDEWEEDSLTVGFAFRPLGHRFTLGVNAQYVQPEGDDIPDFSNGEYLPFASLELIDGVVLSGRGLPNDNYQVNLGLEFGMGGIFYSGNSEETADFSGIGFSFESHEKLSFLKNLYKKKSRYAKLKLEHIFIEEPEPKGPSININFNLFGSGPKTMQLSKFLYILEEMTKDESIKGLIIEYKNIGGGFSKMQAIREALMKFKNAGKEIIVYAQSLSNTAYYVLSLADKLVLTELGGIDLRGLTIEVSFFKGLMDTLGIVAEFQKISPYKSAADPFLRENMSDEMREQYSLVFDEIYAEFIRGIAENRAWSEDDTKEFVDNGPYMVRAEIDKLIDGWMYPDQYEEMLSEMKKENDIFPFHKYLKNNEYVYNWSPDDKEKIAVVYAVGSIVPGKSRHGKSGSTIMGDKTIRDAIIKARKDESVKAIVLRIDSGGGSALASDLMWREVKNTRDINNENHKPIVASMSSVAASGGYYIACGADKIVAEPNTITGSIGVLGGRLNLSGLKEKIGINTERIKYGEHSDYWSGNKRWTDEESQMLHDGIVDAYGTFLSRVAADRPELDSLAVHKHAVGKIWTGNQAKERKLIDEVGDFKTAIKIAKEMAGIPEDEKLQIEEYPKFKFDLMEQMGINIQTIVRENLPEFLQEEAEILDIIPVLESDRMHYIMPYRIEIK